MDGYYKKANSTIRGGYPAYASKINEIQENVDIAISSEISDLDGPAFLLSAEQDALELTPVTNGIDLYHTGTVNYWLSTENMYVRRKLDIVKNEIQKISIKLKNSGAEEQKVSFRLYTDEFDKDDQIDPIATYSITVPAGTVETEYDLNFAAKHLNREYHYLYIERTDNPDVYIGCLEEIEGQPEFEVNIEISPNDYDWDESPSRDLWFEEYYAGSMSFDIVDAVAVINGRKVNNLDTHLEMPAASVEADRIDIVYMDGRGWLLIEEGIASTDPEASSMIEPIDLVIAHIDVPRACSSSLLMTVDQTDTYGENRPRSQEERIRRIIQKQEHDWEFNPPERITEERYSGFGSGESIEWNSDGYYEIGTVQGTEYLTDTFKPPTTIDENATSNVDIDDENGIITLKKTSTAHSDLEMLAVGDMITESRGAYFRSTTEQSRFFYNVFYPPTNLNVTEVELALGALTNATGVCLWFIDYTTDTLVMKSDVLPIAEYKNVERGRAQWQNFTFPSTMELTGGNKYRIIIEAIPETGKMAEIYAPVYASTNQPTTKVHVEHRYLTYPHRVGYLSPKYYDVRDYYIPMRFNNVAQDVYESTGTIIGEAYTAGHEIKKVRTDLNINLVSETGYKVYVSNNNGETWYQYSGSSYTFSAPTTSFKYKIVLTTSNTSKTPIIQYNTRKQYGLKFTFICDSDTPAAEATLTTTVFDGQTIAYTYLGTANTEDNFSMWEWLLTKIDPQGGTVTVTVKYSNNNSSWYDWGPIDSVDLLDAFENTDPEYHDYPETYEEFRYNHYCDWDGATPQPFAYRYFKYEFVLTKEDNDVDAPSPRVYMVGAIMEVA